MPYQSTLDNFLNTGTMEMQQKSTQMNWKISSSSLEDFLVKLSALLEKEKDLTMQEEHYFLKLQGFSETKNPYIFYSKTLKVYYLTMGGGTFKKILEVLDELGYDVTWKVYNSKDYDVPQNRERVFIKGCFRGKGRFQVLFKPRKSKTIINGVEGKVIRLNKKPQAQTVYDINGLSCCLSANGGGDGGKTGLYLLNGTADGNIATIDANYHKGLGPADVKKNRRRRTHIIEKPNGDKMEIVQPVLTPDRAKKRQNGRRMKNNNEPMFTLTAQDKHGIYDGYTVRKLTPVECERLQGFPDNWTKYGKDGEIISDTQRYKCCGNAVTTNVITAIVDEMFEGVV